MNLSSLIRRDPQKGKRGLSTRTGFTVIEMMVVLAVLAIIASLSLPSYQVLLDKRRVTSGAVQLAAFLSAAQIESVKRNEQLSVNYDMADDGSWWCVGLISSNAACDCTAAVDESNACLIDSQLRVFSQDQVNNPNVMGDMNGDGQFVFDPVRGLMLEHTDAFEAKLVSPENIYALNVQVSASGRVVICRDSTAKEGTGYGEC